MSVRREKISSGRYEFPQLRKYSQQFQMTQVHSPLPFLSQKHEKVQNSRKILQISQAIRSIMSMGVMQKMQLITINNRSMFIQSKVKRVQWLNRKHHPVSPQMKFDPKDIRLDTRKNKAFKAKSNKEMKKMQWPVPIFSQQDKQLIQRLIDEYLNRFKQQNNVVLNINKEDLVRQACLKIKQQIQNTRNQNKSPEKLQKLEDKKSVRERLLTESPQVRIRESNNKSTNLKSRSITEVQYAEQLARINKSSQFSSKLRARNEKLFLRKIRYLKSLNNTDSRSPSKDQ